MSAPLRVLLVKDSDDQCGLLARQFEQGGFAPDWSRVASVSALRQSLEAREWDLILATHDLPDLDLVTVVSLTQDLTPGLPVIVLRNPGDKQQALAVRGLDRFDDVTVSDLPNLVPTIQQVLIEGKERALRHRHGHLAQGPTTESNAVMNDFLAAAAILDNRGVVLGTKGEWRRFFHNQPNHPGWSDAVGKNYLELTRATQSPDRSRVLSGIQAVLDGERPIFSWKSRIGEISDGREYIAQAVSDGAGAGAIVTHIDVGGCDRTVASSCLSEAQFRGVVESLGEGLLLTGLDDRVIYANSRMAQLAGFSAQDLLHQAASTLIPSEAGRSAPSGLEATVPERAELQLLRKDGTTLWVEVNAAPLRDSQGNVIGLVRAFTDISERRQAREALRKSQASLLWAQRIGRVGSWELNVPTRAMEWSAETYRIFDRVPQGHAPTFEQLTELLAEEDRVRVEQGLELALRDKTSYQADCWLVRQGGARRFVHLQAQIIVDAAENPVQMVGTVQDITERKLLEEQLRQSQKMDAVGQLAGGIAHDFNNILTVIQGYTELISYQPELNTQTRTYANQISVSAERASRLTRQLLAFGRKQLIQLKSLDLNALVHQLSGMLQGLLGEQSQLRLNLQANLPFVLADSGLFEQVLVNLVVNARDAMPKGGRLFIETSLHQIDNDYCRVHPESAPGTYLCLGVIDTGSGMDAKTMDHLFEPFFTTKDVGRGTGLGLPTVYGIVKQHQGWIQVSSEFGRGSAFRIYLPAAPSTSPGPEGAASIPLANGGTETVLLVEDEPALRGLAKCILERYGYRVVEAACGPDALTVWADRKGEIDLLLTDMVMPGGMTGRELALRLEAQKPSLKVLYTSGYSVDFVEGNLFLREGVNFVPKPYNGTSLSQAVRSCLDRAR